MSDRENKPANAEKVYIVHAKDLPLSCPSSEMALWNSHPKVYLPIEKTKKERCPYCSAVYILEDD